MKSQKQLMTAERESMDPAAVLQNELQEKYQNALISYYIALHYVQEHQNQGVKQALIILQSCQYKIEDAIEFAQENNLKGDKTESMINELSIDTLKKVEFAMCKCHAKYLNIQHAQKAKSSEAQKQENQIDSSSKPKGQVGGGKSAKSVKFDNLYDMLFDNK